jgi:methionyl-tRNA formyltransferase
MRLVFLGSGGFAIPSFEALLAAGHDVAALVTQPDREKGRGRQLATTPLKPVAERHGIPVLQPLRVREPDAIAALAALKPHLHVVVAYGQILPRPVLELAPLGTVNVHASLLPRYRGAAPIQWAVVRGERETGVTTMLLDEGLDTGPILLARPTPIGPEETAGELQDRLAHLGAELLVETLAGLEAGSIRPRQQDPLEASLAPILTKADGRLAWERPARHLHQQVRGFAPWPGAFTFWRGQQLKVHRARVLEPGPGEPGSLFGLDGTSLAVACGDATRLGLVEVQLEGRRRVSGAAFAAGARPGTGARLG